jgi:hypothetical protein
MDFFNARSRVFVKVLFDYQIGVLFQTLAFLTKSLNAVGAENLLALRIRTRSDHSLVTLYQSITSSLEVSAVYRKAEAIDIPILHSVTKIPPLSPFSRMHA